MKKSFVPVCCFCSHDISRRGPDPISLSIFSDNTIKDTEQTFWCHSKCFAAKIYDKTLLREELGGPKFDRSKIRPVKGKELDQIKRAIEEARRTVMRNPL